MLCGTTYKEFKSCTDRQTLVLSKPFVSKKGDPDIAPRQLTGTTTLSPTVRLILWVYVIVNATRRVTVGICRCSQCDKEG